MLGFSLCFLCGGFWIRFENGDGDDISNRLHLACEKILGTIFTEHLDQQTTQIRSMFSSIVAAFICYEVATFGTLSSVLVSEAFSATIFFVRHHRRPFFSGKNIELPYWLITVAMIAGLQSFGMMPARLRNRKLLSN